MICTSSYNDCQKSCYKTYGISSDYGKNIKYEGEYYPSLAPRVSFLSIWYGNIGKISEEENNKYYIQEYYKQVLSKLDPEEVYRELDNSILLGYESNTNFSNRHIVSAWFEILLDVDVKEVKVKNNQIIQVDRPNYIKKYLEESMKQSVDMRGFKSLRALYLFEQAEMFEKQANEFEERTGKNYNDCRQFARTLKKQAHDIDKNGRRNQ